MKCIYGLGGFARETYYWLLDAYDISVNDAAQSIAFMVDDEYYSESSFMGCKVLKRTEYKTEDLEIVIAIGDPTKREKIVKSLPSNANYFNIIHPTVVMSSDILIGDGAILCPGVILTGNIKIGKHCHLNLNSTIGHDCVIGNYFTTAPAVNISGNNEISDRVYMGTQAATREKIKITDDVVVGMGSMVVKPIIESGLYLGIPATKK